MALASVYIKLHEGSWASKKIIMALEVACSEQLSPTNGMRRTPERQAGEILPMICRIFFLFSLSITI